MLNLCGAIHISSEGIPSFFIFISAFTYFISIGCIWHFDPSNLLHLPIPISSKVSPLRNNLFCTLISLIFLYLKPVSSPSFFTTKLSLLYWFLALQYERTLIASANSGDHSDFPLVTALHFYSFCAYFEDLIIQLFIFLHHFPFTLIFCSPLVKKFIDSVEEVLFDERVFYLINIIFFSSHICCYEIWTVNAIGSPANANI